VDIRGEDVTNLEKAIELLQCAEINCDNAKSLGIVMVQLVKLQVTEALDILERPNEEYGE
jgi:hypothetical protein